MGRDPDHGLGSDRDGSPTRPGRLPLGVAAAFAGLALALAAGAAFAAGPDDTARELDAIQSRIQGMERDIAKAAAQRPTAGKALKQAEVIEADARRDLRRVRNEISAARAREKALRADMARAETELADHRRSLAAQLRLAYSAGREEWLKLTLSQQDPVVLARRVVHYGYITRQRGALIEAVRTQLATLEAAAVSLREEIEKLNVLDRQQQARVQEVATARKVRARAVETIDRDLGDRRSKLKKLQQEARTLQQLMARLAREAQAAARRQAAPRDTRPPQQTTDLPLRGRMVARFGQPRADGLLRWEGAVLAAPAGTSVRAVRGGRVVYADWLPGMGQLVVIDHGGGMMSLYGHNQEILAATGTDVRQGEAIARVGDSGGQGTPGLYFEMRRDGKPVNPAPWIK
ncbi:MAG: hypothetical protein FJ197_01360 [Gammaproteobacteria bacterium]|nr:hypothetical protein [Gammaproteobacteria bacterium]